MTQDKWRILVVEDDPDGQVVVATMLERLNIHIDVASSAEEAEAMLFQSDRQYTAIILDLALPGKDGWELLAEIRADRSTEDVPCIAVTAHHSTRLREEALQAGFTSYFAKPIDGTSLARNLERILTTS